MAEGDAAGLEALRPRAWPNLAEEHDAAWHRRLYAWLATHPMAEQLHRWVIDADGEIVGHLAAVPQWYRIGGRRVLAHTPADYMVLPQYGFHAVLLMRTCFKVIDNCVSCDAPPQVIAIESRFGAVAAADLDYGIKPLVLANRSAGGSPLARAGLGVAGAYLHTVDRVMGRTAGGKLTAAILPDFDASFDALLEAVAAVEPCVLEKDQAFLRWRYGAGSPQAPVTILGIKEDEMEGERLLGYAVLRQGPQRVGYILDLLTLPGRADVSRALLRDSLSHLRSAGAYVVRYRLIPSQASVTRRLVRRFGFVDRQGSLVNRVLPHLPRFKESRPYTLLVKFADAGADETARVGSHWTYSFGDTEASFWVG